MNSINSTYKIRRAERNDLCAISDIYNYEVANGTATFDIHPSTMPELETWFAAHNVDNHPLIVIETGRRIRFPVKIPRQGGLRRDGRAFGLCRV